MSPIPANKSLQRRALTLHICSFGFRKSGIPADPTGHGGGYVFDCRGLPNPGRYEHFSTKTGQDPDVIAFLEADKAVDEFLQHVLSLVNMHARHYAKRGFIDLTICFGCTGGQHRSVYCAEIVARELRKEGYTVELKHIDKPEF